MYNLQSFPLECFCINGMHVDYNDTIIISSPVAVPSVVTIITMISTDNGLVRLSDNVTTDPCSSTVYSDDLFKQIIVSIKMNNYTVNKFLYILHTYINYMYISILLCNIALYCT